MNKQICIIISLFLAIAGALYAASDGDICLTLVDGEPHPTAGPASANIILESDPDIDGMVDAIISTRNPDTNLSPSHWGHPGYENLAFLYDKAVDALVLKSAGRQKEAEDILDYVVGRFNIPIKQVVEGRGYQ